MMLYILNSRAEKKKWNSYDAKGIVMVHDALCVFVGKNDRMLEKG